MKEQLLDTWKINNRINLYLLDAIADEALGISAPMGRSVAQQFAHMHNVRLMWLKSGVPELLEGLEKIEQAVFSKDMLRYGLEDSGRAIEGLLMRGIAAGKIKGFKPHPTAFLGYLIAHDAYHRAEIGLILTQSGHPLDQKTSYGMWEWGSR